MSHEATIGVMPIVPAASSLLAVILASSIGLLSAIASLRLSAVRKFVRFGIRQLPVFIALSLLTGLAVRELGRFFASPPPIAPSESIADSITGAWPVYRGTIARTGHADRSPGPNRGGIQWSGGRDHDFFSSPAIIGDQVIAIGSKGDSARVFSWNAKTGEQIWSFAPPGYRATFSSPVIDNGYLYCGEGLHQTSDARVMSFKLNSTIAPTLGSQAVTRGHVECTPAVADGRVYIGAGDDGIYCFEVPDGSTTELKLVWHATGEKYPDAETALAVYQGRVYFGLGFEGEALCVLDAATGSEIQRIKLPYPCFSPPAIHEGRLYLGMGRADFSNYRDSGPGEVRCLDLASLNTIWSLATPAAVLTSIVVDREHAIFSTVDGQLFVVNRGGQIAGRWHAHAAMLAAPAVTDRMIYCVACDGLLTALNSQLERVWSVRLGVPGDYVSSPVVFNGHVYVGTPNDGLVCVGETPSQVVNEENSNSHSQISSSIPREVDIAWTFPGPTPGKPADVSAPPTIARTDLFVPMMTKTWSGLVCARSTDSSTPQSRWVFDASERIEISPCVRGDHVFCVSGAPGQPGRLFCLDRATGGLKWSQELVQVPSWMELDGDDLVLQTDTSQLMRLTPHGAATWRTETGRLNHRIEVAGEIIVAASSTPNQLIALDRLSGQILWNCPLKRSPTAAPIVLKTHVFLATERAIEIHSLLDGSLLETRDDWSELTTMFVDGNRLIGVSSPTGQMSGELLIGQIGSRSPTRRLPDARSHFAPLVGIDAITYAVDERRLKRISRMDEVVSERWYEVAGTGQIRIAPVLFDERVYVSVAGVGLVCLESRSVP